LARYITSWQSGSGFLRNLTIFTTTEAMFGRLADFGSKRGLMQAIKTVVNPTCPI